MGYTKLRTCDESCDWWKYISVIKPIKWTFILPYSKMSKIGTCITSINEYLCFMSKIYILIKKIVKYKRYNLLK